MGYPGYTDKDEQKVRNRLQQRMARFREKFVMVSWRDTAGDNNAIKDRVLESLTQPNSLRGVGLGRLEEVLLALGIVREESFRFLVEDLLVEDLQRLPTLGKRLLIPRHRLALFQTVNVTWT